MDEEFWAINRNTSYLTKKSLRKILRGVNKYVKYSGIKQTEIDLRIYFCAKVKAARIAIDTSVVLSNLYNREIEKIKTILSKLHEDLQYDYKQELERLLQ
jgi:N-glycosylase/DNA lyase